MRGTQILQTASFERWRTLRQREQLPALEREQRQVAEAVTRLQKQVCVQVAQGIVEILGISAWPAPEAEGVWVQLPAGSDIGLVARAITLEGAAARPADDAPYLLLPVQPWFDAAEIDQTVLCCAKVCHVMLGIHPPTMDLATHLTEGTACHWQPSAVPESAAAD